ncbi:P-loop containing nucleoside triphosphate hydrolase protein [Heliocybe sulcata]|uniref:P-loop containing nucleoside triphosphate hydrolase protein n=1 Tax=Heliocybe sulcata TaxID=5364 RepID=A0A5C3MRU1_9AGAM|nr:P-loop containing nucleoside triphosphate hydrolase protein [Heliocybe sulcata]
MPRVDVSPPDSDVENVPPAWPNMMANNGRAHRGDDYFDENGDFFGRGKDTFAGPIAKADDIDKFLVAAGNAEQFDGNASVDRALAKLNLNSIFDPLPGMTVALMPHQAIGVAWMLGMEKSIYRGGCMADEMGLGKTVQMMSVIVSNQSDDPMQKTTLIVAPLALLDQWQMELESKTDCGITCLIYHGQTKPRKKSDLLKYDVILTTFGTLAMEWPDAEAQEKKKKQRNRQSAKKKDSFVVSDSDYSDDAPSRRKSKKKQTRGLLFEVDWWRIVIDEAQNIRNRRTRVSRAVSEMSAKYRWCLTGTPIINGLGDAYGTLRFLKIRPWYDWKEFNGHVARLEKKNPTLATTRLQVIFTSMLIRRKKDSMLDGKRLVELPPKTVELRKLEFTTDEREIYNMVEVKSQAVFNRFLRAGTVLKNYHQVLVMLLRLRQICSHPSLIYEKGGAFANGDDGIDDSLVQPEAKSELDRAAKLVSPEFVARMRFRFKQAALHRIQAEKESDDAAADDEECPIRMDGMVDPMLTPCTHVFCRECIQNVLNGPHVDDANNEIRYKADERPCPTCRGAISETKLFSRLAFEPTDQELEKAMNPESDRVDVDDVMKKTKSAKGKARKRNARRMMYSSDAEEAGADDIEDDEEDEEEEDEDDDDLRDFIVQDDEDEEEKDERRAQKKRLGKARAIVLDSDDEADAEIIYGKKSPEPVRPADGKIRLMSKFIPSTKMKHMMENLLQCAKEGPDEKTLIISQWTQNLDLVSSYLTENGILHVKYQGDMDRAKRDQAVRVFMAKDKAKVMLMSLKCGGVGLNLTRANRVISLDLGWSEAIENQAFDRVHRLGQHRPVFVSRLVIGDTVEDRILALQERKRNLAEGSLGEGAGKKVGRLSVRELANLFGMDTRGRLLHNDA